MVESKRRIDPNRHFVSKFFSQAICIDLQKVGFRIELRFVKLDFVSLKSNESTSRDKDNPRGNYQYTGECMCLLQDCKISGDIVAH
jgi:hypothetical protein